jgi:hypothetical protein
MKSLFFLSTIPLISSHQNSGQDCYAYVISKWTSNYLAVDSLGSYAISDLDKKFSKEVDTTGIDIFKKKLQFDMDAIADTPLDSDWIDGKFTIINRFTVAASKINPQEEIKSLKVPRIIACFKIEEEISSAIKNAALERLKSSADQKTTLGIGNFHVYYVDSNSQTATHSTIDDKVKMKNPDGGTLQSIAQDIPIAEFFTSPHFVNFIKGKQTDIFLLADGSNCYTIKIPKPTVIRSFEKLESSKQRDDL